MDDLLGELQGLAPQPAQTDHPRECRQAKGRMGLPDARHPPFETTPLVVDGVMYISQPPSTWSRWMPKPEAVWRYPRTLPSKINVCCGQVNRGVALLGDRVFVGTVDAHWSRSDAKTGDVIWDVPVADHRTGHSLTVAPLAVKDMIVCGISRRRIWNPGLS